MLGLGLFLRIIIPQGSGPVGRMHVPKDMKHWATFQSAFHGTSHPAGRPWLTRMSMPEGIISHDEKPSSSVYPKAVLVDVANDFGDLNTLDVRSAIVISVLRSSRYMRPDFFVSRIGVGNFWRLFKSSYIAESCVSHTASLAPSHGYRR